jgi:3-deoxy-D-manno-octulosonic-acid transferase
MKALYNLLFTVFFALSAPFYFLKMWRRGNWQRGFAMRFGRYSAKFKQSITNRHVIWLHAVSVGEVNVCTQLIRALEPRIPNVKIVVSTTTSTGMAELQKRLPSHIEKIYYPIDRRKFVARAFRLLHPEAIVLVEAEIWPNFLWRARSSGIPIFLVNARLSEKSFRGYRRFGALFRPLFASFTGVGVQNERDAERLRILGARPEAIHVVGNLKFDAARLHERPLFQVPSLLRQLGLRPDAKVLVGGSTHAGEEAILARVYRRLKGQFPELFLIIVPRHFERGREIGQELKEAGLQFVYRTEISADDRFEPGHLDALLVNTTGELRLFYEAATAIFVGKSLTAQGGQNPIEPAALGKPVVFGPNMQNFQPIAQTFVDQNGALEAHSEAELEIRFRQILADPNLRAELGRNALRVVRENQGSIERTVEMIVKHLHGGEMYVAPHADVVEAGS